MLKHSFNGVPFIECRKKRRAIIQLMAIILLDAASQTALCLAPEAERRQSASIHIKLPSAHCYSQGQALPASSAQSIN